MDARSSHRKETFGRRVLSGRSTGRPECAVWQTEYDDVVTCRKSVRPSRQGMAARGTTTIDSGASENKDGISVGDVYSINCNTVSAFLD